ncbi:MAG: tricarballylate utilization 4Fe-4S protein TcuB [Acidobacteriia bacterium]|nr:tricarballylate utilization 4Fe-4S protein TcuB [Terriglobia bacterium]
MRETEAVIEARRLMVICNACRYCEGYCAVFPAMELRRSFSNGDLGYLANLCHDCRGCYYACQYAPPHEFALNLPQALARVRSETYAEYAWPRPLAGLFQRNGMFVSLLTSLGIAVVLIFTARLQPSAILYGPHRGPGAFYAVIPEAAMIGVGGATFAFAMLALVMGFLNFWRDTGGGPVAQARSLLKAASDVLTLHNLGGGGYGCNNRDEAFSQTRRYSHQAMFYGFLLCFASTCTAAFYEHVLGLAAPYPFLSIPVLLGTAGGFGMLIGTAGLAWVKVGSDPAPAANDLLGADYALLALLFLSAATGLLLLVLRDTRAMGILLALHLGVILSFFLTLPYSKFVHGIYRSAALLRHAVEHTR